MDNRKSLVSLLVVVLLGAVIAWAGSSGGAMASGLPVFALCIALAFVIQWVVFVPSFLRQTERFYDLTGMLSYLSVTALALALAGEITPRSALLGALVIIWTSRLGTFLFRRISAAGKDDRFDDLKPHFLRFLNTWTIQGLWVSLTAGAALAAITSGAKEPSLDPLAFVGLAVWLVGFSIEAVADAQKSAFRAVPENKGRFISTGLWAWSRHPNYFGEITLWIGVALIALPDLQGWQYLTLISPVFVFVLLTRVSGVPLLERKADATWGGQPEYEAYKARTPVLYPRPPRR